MRGGGGDRARDGGARRTRHHSSVRGRACQEVVYDPTRWRGQRKMPAIPIYIDSPLAVSDVGVQMHPEVFDRTEGLVQMVQELFRFELVTTPATCPRAKP